MPNIKDNSNFCQHGPDRCCSDTWDMREDCRDSLVAVDDDCDVDVADSADDGGYCVAAHAVDVDDVVVAVVAAPPRCVVDSETVAKVEGTRIGEVANSGMLEVDIVLPSEAGPAQNSSALVESP